MLQVDIWITIKQVSSLSDQVFLRSLTKAIATQQEHIIFALSICRFLFEIAPNMLKSIWIAFKQISSLSNHIFLRSLTKAVAIKQEHIVLALSICRFLFEIAPNMLKGIANLTSVFWNLAGTINHLFNLTHLHHFLL